MNQWWSVRQMINICWICFFYGFILGLGQFDFIYNQDMDQNKLLLGYWKSRGRGEVARQLMALYGVQWTEKQYTDDKEWFEKDKKELELPLPNLPYLIDGDLKLTESIAIYRHIIRKFGKRELLGRNINDEAVVDSLASIWYDIDHALVHLFWDPEWKSKIDGGKNLAVPKLKKINELYGNKTFALDYLTLPDLLFAELSYYMEKIIPEQYKELTFLARLRTQILNIPEIKQYYETKGSLSFVEQGDLAF